MLWNALHSVFWTEKLIVLSDWSSLEDPGRFLGGIYEFKRKLSNEFEIKIRVISRSNDTCLTSFLCKVLHLVFGWNVKTFLSIRRIFSL